MALTPFFASEADVPEAFRAEYIEKTIGEGDVAKKVWMLDVTPTEGFALENVAGLTSALGRLKENTPKLKAFTDLNMSAADIANAVAELETLKASTGDNEAAAVKNAREELERLKTQHESAIEESKKPLQQQMSVFQTQLEEVLLTQALTKAIVDAGGGETLDLLVPALRPYTRTRIDEDTQKVVAEVIDDTGQNARIGTDLKPFTFEALVAEKKALPAFAPAFPADGASGRGGESGGGGAGGGNEGSQAYTEQQIADMPQAEFEKLRMEGRI